MSAYTKASQPPYWAARATLTPVNSISSRGSTGRMMPKPIESTSTAMNTKTKALLPALAAVIGGLARFGPGGILLRSPR